MSGARPTKYWLVVVSKDHVETGKKLGIVQANHGKAAPMKRMKPGDLIVFYSPKLHFHGTEPLKKFTAIARVKDGEVYQGDMGGGFSDHLKKDENERVRNGAAAHESHLIQTVTNRFVRREVAAPARAGPFPA